MRIVEKEFILSYIAAQRQRYDNEIIELQRRIRYRRIDIVDLVEYMLLVERSNAFEEFACTIINILHLN